MILSIGQRVILPKLPGEFQHKRAGTITEEYEHFYVVKTDIGYNECIQKTGESKVEVL